MTKCWADKVDTTRKAKGDLVFGIDPVLADIPETFKRTGADAPDVVRDYIVFLLEQTSDQIGFVKFQSAFFEALGSSGLRVLADSIGEARQLGHEIILDAKRGDVGGTAAAYAQAYLTPANEGGLSDLEVDCMTVNPFLGPETLQPFLHCAKNFGKGLFVLVKTSNPGAGWLQDKQIDGIPVSDHLAQLIAGWANETKGSCGLSSIGAVVGATYPEDGQRLRRLMPISLFLSPGLGPQGATPDSIFALRRADGDGVLVPVQRGLTKTEDLSLSKEAYGLLVRSRVEEFKTKLAKGAAQ